MFSTWNSTLRELLAALPKRRRHVQEGPLSDEFVRLFIPWQGPDRRARRAAGSPEQQREKSGSAEWRGSWGPRDSFMIWPQPDPVRKPFSCSKESLFIWKKTFYCLYFFLIVETFYFISLVSLDP